MLTIDDSVAAWLTVERTPTSLTVNGESALTMQKTQQKLTALVGDFATWQRTRVFDADLTARFGAEGDTERKRLLERLLGLEKLDAGLKRCRDDIREAEKRLAVIEQGIAVANAGLAEQPAATQNFDIEALARSTSALRELELRASQLARDEGRLSAEATAAERALAVFRGGHCPTCEQPISVEKQTALRDVADSARRDREATMLAGSKAKEEAAGLLAEVRQMRDAQAQTERAAAFAARRAELSGRREAAQAERGALAKTLARLRAVEAFIVAARTKLLESSLAHLEAAATAWLPDLELRVEGDGLIVRHGARTYKELNEGHRRLCDLAVLLGLSSFGDAKVKGPIFLDGALHGLDEDRQDAVAALLETVAQRELVIVLTCVEDAARRLGGMHVSVVDGVVKY